MLLITVHQKVRGRNPPFSVVLDGPTMFVTYQTLSFALNKLVKHIDAYHARYPASSLSMKVLSVTSVNSRLPSENAMQVLGMESLDTLPTDPDKIGL